MGGTKELKVMLDATKADTIRKFLLCLFLLLLQLPLCAQNKVKWGISLTANKEYVFSEETPQHDYLSLNFSGLKNPHWQPGYGLFVELPSFAHDRLSIHFNAHSFRRMNKYFAIDHDPELFSPPHTKVGFLDNRAYGMGISPSFTFGRYFRLHAGYEIQLHKQLKKGEFIKERGRDIALLNYVKQYNIRPALHNLTYGLEFRIWHLGLDYTISNGLHNVLSPIPYEDHTFYPDARTINHWLKLNVYFQEIFNKKGE